MTWGDAGPKKELSWKTGCGEVAPLQRKKEKRSTTLSCCVSSLVNEKGGVRTAVFFGRAIGWLLGRGG